MRKPILSMAMLLVATIFLPSVAPAAEPSRQAAEQKTLNALFNRSPEGLPIDTVNESRTKDGKPAQDADGGLLKRTFSAQDRADLQRIAWEGLQQFQQLAASADHQ